MTVRVHPFPFRTRQLSSLVLTILAWRRAGKIGRCQHYKGCPQSRALFLCFHGGFCAFAGDSCRRTKALSLILSFTLRQKESIKNTSLGATVRLYAEIKHKNPEFSRNGAASSRRMIYNNEPKLIHRNKKTFPQITRSPQSTVLRASCLIL